MNQNVLKHLSKDPMMKKLIARYGELEWGNPVGLHQSLLETIVSQQLSVKAADTIFARISGLLGNPVDPRKLAKVHENNLRDAGASFSKIKYMKGIAEAKLKGELEDKIFAKLSDEEVAARLIKLKGIGPWTIEMVLIFTLRRPDTFSIGDLGLRSAVAKLYNVDRDDREKIIEISEKWKPYRSYAARYLWKSLDNTPR
ncbi:DNA-3-methyladenine glycosylase 2 family protein [Candidatus Microgenomates bacterium]|nr:MAG: DNA-3-methyladenine glycosylase 2 family protein [Candidatus Microgenomates bacterium]